MVSFKKFLRIGGTFALLILILSPVILAASPPTTQPPGATGGPFGSSKQVPVFSTKDGKVTAVTNVNIDFPDPSPASVHWVYVVNDGSGVSQIKRASDPAITVTDEANTTGVYTVTFPEDVTGLACTASINNSGGFITCIPGDSAGLLDNQVRVITSFSTGGAAATLDFTLVVHF